MRPDDLRKSIYDLGHELESTKIAYEQQETQISEYEKLNLEARDKITE